MVFAKKRRQEIETQLIAITYKFLQELEATRAQRAISLDASLERDLGIGSLGKVELLRQIENTFSVQLSEKAIAEAETLSDFVKLIEKAGPSLKINPQTFSPVIEKSIIDLSTTTTYLDALHLYALEQPHRPHLYFQNERGEEQIITYGQLFAEATKVAKGLHQRGIQPEETVAIMLPTCEEFFYAFLGVLLAGAIPVPIYPPFRPDRIEEYAKREARILQNAQVRLLITFSRAEILGNILQTFIPSLKEVTLLKNLQAKSGDLPEIIIEPSNIALIQYTSGSTGDPKGVTLTHANMLANIHAIGKAVPVTPMDVGVSWLPLYHDMGLMMWLGSLYFGVPLTILSPLTFLTRPERWLWAIHYHQATLSGAPNFAYELCVKKINPQDIEGLDLSSWRFAFNGAEAIRPKTLDAFTKKFAPYGFKPESFAPVYGLAEATVGLTFPTKTRLPRVDKVQREAFEKDNKAVPVDPTSAENYLEFVACGEPMAGYDIRIVDNENNEQSERVVGNIQFKGPSAMQGYYNNPTATQQAYCEGWWNTGDLGYLADKELVITGRKKDLIIKAGRNLYPEEVENAVNQIPSVRKGCVIAFGVNDEKSGTEKLVVVAETYELGADAERTIRAEIIEQMSIMLGIPPDVVVLVPPHSISKTSSGKLQRSACKQDYLKGKLGKQRLPAKMQLFKLALISSSKKIYNWCSYLVKLVYLGYVGLLALICVPLAWLSLLLLPSKAAAKTCQFFARNFFRLAGCPIKLSGKEYLQGKPPLIFVANHASYIDSLLMLAILPRDVAFVAKKELLTLPLVKTFIKKLNHLTVDRMYFKKSLEDTQTILSTVSGERSILIFPEGTFTYATGLRPFKLGAFTLAVETGVPICPISIRGARTILRGGQFLPTPGKLNVTICAPITPKRNDWNEITRLHSIVRTEIAKHCGEPVIDVIVSGPVAE